MTDESIGCAASVLQRLLAKEGATGMESDARASFVLVPGAGGDGWYWHRVADELTRRGHRAVPVDLPADDDEAGLEAYADVITRAAKPHDHRVLVAQSMGALSAPLVCARLPVAMLVLVNAMIPASGESGGQWWEATGHHEARVGLADREGRQVSDDVDVVEDFLHDLPADVLAQALARGGPDQSARPFADPFPLPHWPDVPTRVVAGRDDRFFPVDFQGRLARERLGIDATEVPGGHCLALSRPVELADVLVGFWRQVASPQPG